MTEFEELARARLKRCEVIRDFDERLRCRARVVHEASEAQDIANLSARGDLYDEDPQASLDSRWEAVHMLDDANAVFLGVTDYDYDPERFMRWGYVEEKADSFCRRWNRIQGSDLGKRTDAEREEARRRFYKKGDGAP